MTQAITETGGFPWGPPTSIELLLFLLDGSGSMAERITDDKRMKAEHLLELLRGNSIGALDSLSEREITEKVHSFLVSIAYFAGNVYVQNVEFENKDKPYFWLEHAISVIKSPLDAATGDGTAIGKAVKEAAKIVKLFLADEDIPISTDNRHVTVFLFTDGIENAGGDVKTEVAKLKAEAGTLNISIATVSFGKDAAIALLQDIASELKPEQKRRLMTLDLLRHMPNQNKLYLEGHIGGKLTKEKADVVRRFVQTLSITNSESNAKE